jgi:hypothetical protein
MPRFPARLAAAALSLLAFSACDTGGTDEPGGNPDDLVGSWSLQETTTETFLTVNEAQQFVDRAGPQTGSVALTGAVTGALRHIVQVPDDYYGDAILASHDPYGTTQPDTRYELRMSQSGQVMLTVQGANGNYSQYYFSGATPAFTYADGRLTVRAITLQDYYGGATRVTVAAGSVSFSTVQFVANQRTRVRSTTVPFEGDPYGGLDLRYVLEEDGDYRAERDFYPNVTQSVAGTWAAEGDRLRLSITEEGVTETQTFRYAVEADRLQLSVTSDVCRTIAYCLTSAEQNFGLRPGSLTAYTEATSAVFAPTVEDDLGRTAQTAPPVDPRREASVWPRALARPVAGQ